MPQCTAACSTAEYSYLFFILDIAYSLNLPNYTIIKYPITGDAFTGNINS